MTATSRTCYSDPNSSSIVLLFSVGPRDHPSLPKDAFPVGWNSGKVRLLRVVSFTIPVSKQRSIIS